MLGSSVWGSIVLGSSVRDSRVLSRLMYNEMVNDV